MKLEITKDYEKFCSNNHQRPIDDRHVAQIAKSINENGFLPSKPIQVYKNGLKFVIVDGHHRFEAAKQIKCGFYYVVEKTQCQSVMAIENKLVKKWSTIDYVRLYASENNHNYQILLHYVQQGIPVMMAASMLYGQQADSGNVSKFIARGDFKAKDFKTIDKIIDFINEHKEDNVVVSTRTFICALCKCLKWDGFDYDHFNKRMKLNKMLLKKAATASQMLDQIEFIYNFKMKYKVPVKIPVEQASKLRIAANRF